MKEAGEVCEGLTLGLVLKKGTWDLTEPPKPADKEAGLEQGANLPPAPCPVFIPVLVHFLGKAH